MFLEEQKFVNQQLKPTATNITTTTMATGVLQAQGNVEDHRRC